MPVMLAGRPVVILSFFLISSFLIIVGVLKDSEDTPAFVVAEKNINSPAESQTLPTKSTKELGDNYISAPTASSPGVLSPTAIPTSFSAHIASKSSYTAEESMVTTETSPTPIMKISPPTSPTPQISQPLITSTPIAEPVHASGCSDGDCAVVISPTPESVNTPIKPTTCGDNGKIPQLDVCLE